MQDHFARARRFLKRKADAKDSGPKQRKIKRRKALAWCAQVDNAMQVSTGLSLRDLVVPEAELAAPSQPLLWVGASAVLDKGSDGVCAAHYLQRKFRLNLLVDYDTSHGAWRSCIGAVNEAQLGTHSFLCLMAYNVGYGEWKDGTRFEQVRTSIQETVQGCSAGQDEVFQFTVNGMLRDKGMSEMPRTEALEESLYRTLEDGGCWRTIYPKLGYSRFFSVSRV